MMNSFNLSNIHNLLLGRKQRGAVSLIMSLVLLASITFVTLYTSKSLITEQKLANNDYRSRMAFEAAEAGLASAITSLSTSPDLDDDGILDGSTATEFLFDTNADATRNSNRVTVGTTYADVEVTDLSGGGFTTLQVQSTGVSDDRTASRVIVRVITTLDPTPENPENPLTTKGTVVINGSATVHNQEGHSTIWSGGDVDLGSNNSTATNVANVASAGYPACMDSPGSCSTIQSSNKTLIGLDVVEHDNNLANLSDDDFFRNFFGSNPTAYQEKHVTLETDNANADTDLDGVNGEVIWVDGSGGTTVLQGTDIGTADNPVVLIIDGDVSFAGNPTVFGIVFITGNLAASGNTSITGAMVVAGTTTNSSGSLDIWFNSDVLNGTDQLGNLGSSSGSWNDISNVM